MTFKYGNEVLSEIGVPASTGIIARPADPKKEGYTFNGWYTNSGCTDGFDFSKPITNDTTIYAKFTSIDYNITVSSTRGGSVSVKIGYREATKANYGNPVTLTVSPYDGYRLESLTVSKTGDAKTKIDVSGSNNVFTFSMPAYDVDVSVVCARDAALIGFDVLGIEDAVYTGKAIKLDDLFVSFNGKELDPKTDYSITYKDNTKVGTATVTITCKGNFEATVTTTFEILPADISGNDFTVENITLKSTGRDQKKTPAIKWNGTAVPAAGYDIVYCAYDTTVDTDEPEAVTSFKTSYAVLFVGKGYFTGKRIAKVTILDDDSVLVSAATVKLSKTTFVLATDANDQGFVVPGVTVTKGKTTYVEDEDYEVTFVDNDKVGTAIVIITGKGGTLSGSVIKTFKINGISLATATVTGVANKVFDPSAADGMTQTGYVVKTKAGTELTEDVDYVVSYKNNTKAGSAQIVFTGIGKYNGSKSASFKIDKAELTAANVEYAESATYCKSGAKPAITVTVNGVTLVPGTDYGVIYAKNNKLNDNNSAAATISGKGNFTGKVVCNFKVTKAVIADKDGSLTVTAADQIYNGTAKTKLSTFLKAPTVKDTDGKSLTANTDYEKAVKYSISADGTTFVDITEDDLKTNLNDFIADKFPTLNYEAKGLIVKAEITLKGNYEGSYSGTYRIASANISTVKAAIADQIFTGEDIVFDPTSADFNDIFDIYIMVKNVKTKLVYGVDFEIVEGSYDKNIKKGTASVTIRGLGKYTGTKKVTFKIVAKTFEN